MPGKEPYLFPEVLPIVPRAGGAAGVLTAGAGKGQLAAAAATAGTDVTGEGNPRAGAFQGRGSWLGAQLAFLKKEESSELGLGSGDRKYNSSS